MLTLAESRKGEGGKPKEELKMKVNIMPLSMCCCDATDHVLTHSLTHSLTSPPQIKRERRLEIAASAIEWKLATGSRVSGPRASPTRHSGGIPTPSPRMVDQPWQCGHREQRMFPNEE